MHKVIAGFSGWAKMRPSRNENVEVVDSAITVVGTLLVALTWVMLHR